MPHGVEFDEWRPPQQTEPESRMVRWVIAHSGGLIRSRSSANTVLFVIALAAFMLSLYFFFAA